MTQFVDDVIDVDAVVVGQDAAPSEPATTTALTAIAEAAKQAIVPLNWSASEKGLSDLRAELGGKTFDVSTEEGYKAAREAVRRCVGIRTGADEAYKVWNQPVMALQKTARERRDYIIGEVEKVENPLKAQVDAEKVRRDAEAVEKARVESARIDAHQAALKLITDAPKTMVSASVADISAKIAELTDPDFLPARDWQEYAQQAAEAVREAVTTLRQHLANAEAREQLAAIHAEREREEQERQRAEGLRERIRNIQNSPTICIGLGSEQIQKQLKRLDATLAADFAELAGEAQAAIDAARTALQTLLDGALAAEAKERQAEADAAELRQLRAAAEARERADREAAEAKEREEKEAAERAEREEREAREREAREEQERIERQRREQEEAAAALAARVREQAAHLLNLVTLARPHVAASTLDGAAELVASIDAAIATIEG